MTRYCEQCNLELTVRQRRFCSPQCAGRNRPAARRQYPLRPLLDKTGLTWDCSTTTTTPDTGGIYET